MRDERSEFGSIGKWSEDKHRILEAYASAYSTILASQKKKWSSINPTT